VVYAPRLPTAIANPTKVTATTPDTCSRRFITVLPRSWTNGLPACATHKATDVLETQVFAGNLVLRIELQDPFALQVRELDTARRFIEKKHGAFAGRDFLNARHAEGDAVQRATFDLEVHQAACFTLQGLFNLKFDERHDQLIAVVVRAPARCDTECLGDDDF